ncbi:hypothetical protein PCI56_00410 [Plesiomonas shigelloides subsp. oncorhynchi]|nr:hypothetical protein [Plesiomonas shigelloides]
MAFDFVNDPPGKPESRVPDYNPLGKFRYCYPTKAAAGLTRRYWPNTLN